MKKLKAILATAALPVMLVGCSDRGLFEPQPEYSIRKAREQEEARNRMNEELERSEEKSVKPEIYQTQHEGWLTVTRNDEENRYTGILLTNDDKLLVEIPYTTEAFSRNMEKILDENCNQDSNGCYADLTTTRKANSDSYSVTRIYLVEPAQKQQLNEPWNEPWRERRNAEPIEVTRSAEVYDPYAPAPESVTINGNVRDVTVTKNGMLKKPELDVRIYMDDITGQGGFRLPFAEDGIATFKVDGKTDIPKSARKYLINGCDNGCAITFEANGNGYDHIGTLKRLE
ncbi:hypothetical protein GOV11_03445 [Candidatus Woesearchaeota archaeon]|nr:hypothetical protein [Candidatus Woesearchaeota archaeon]